MSQCNEYNVRITCLPPNVSANDLYDELQQKYNVPVLYVSPIQIDKEHPPYFFCDKVTLKSIEDQQILLSLGEKAKLKCKGQIISVVKCNDDHNDNNTNTNTN
eukprot:364687_1